MSNMAAGNISDKDYLQRLLKKADTHCNGFPAERVSVLFRNKPFSYFQNIRRYHHNIMKPYMKDQGGDPRSPINGRLAGLFFGVTLHRGDLPDISPFGDTRVTVPLNEVFNDYANLYFADFYCKPSRTRIHYVTLVLAKSGSSSDDFCRRHLIILMPYDNIYLRKEYYTNTYRTLRRTGVNVEILYTEAIDISNRPTCLTAIMGQGHSTPGGIQKTLGCDICSVNVGWIETNRNVGWIETNRSVGSRETNRSVGRRETNRSVGWRETNRSVGRRETNRSVGWRETNRSVNRNPNANDLTLYDVFVNLLWSVWDFFRSPFR